MRVPIDSLSPLFRHGRRCRGRSGIVSVNMSLVLPSSVNAGLPTSPLTLPMPRRSRGLRPCLLGFCHDIPRHAKPWASIDRSKSTQGLTKFGLHSKCSPRSRTIVQRTKGKGHRAYHDQRGSLHPTTEQKSGLSATSLLFQCNDTMGSAHSLIPSTTGLASHTVLVGRAAIL